jgi:hypothetical protein
MKKSGDFLLAISNDVIQAAAGQLQVHHIRTRDGWLFDIMISNINHEVETDRDMALVMRVKGTTDVAMPKQYLSELSHGVFTGDQLDTIVGIIRMDPAAIPRYYYSSHQLW